VRPMKTCFLSGLALGTIVASTRGASVSQVGPPHGGSGGCCDGPETRSEETVPSVACDRAQLSSSASEPIDAAFAFDSVPNAASTSPDWERAPGTDANDTEAKPVPEPGTAGLVMLAGLTLFRRQRRHL